MQGRRVEMYKSSDETSLTSASNSLVWFCSSMAYSELNMEALRCLFFFP